MLRARHYALVIAACIASTGRVSAARIETKLRTRFDWTKKTCDVATLTFEDLATATDIKKSGAGNMGGVYFLSLSPVVGPECNVVVKPQLDLHDAYASAFANRLNVPVAKTRLLTAEENPKEWERLLVSFENFDLRQAFLVLVGEGGGFVQLMGVAQGKDLYAETDETFGWELCDECLMQQMKQEVEKSLGVDPGADFLPALARRIAAKNRIGQDVKPICKAIWTRISAENKSKAEKYWPDTREGKAQGPPMVCPIEWRQSGDEFLADVQSYFATHAREGFLKVAEEMARNTWKMKEDVVFMYCPDSKKPEADKIAAAEDYARRSYAGASTQADMAMLSAYQSFVNENDGINIFGQITSNFHNVFFSPTRATGIDIAVGGALNHQLIVPGKTPKEMEGDGLTFAYFEVQEAALVTTCGTDEDIRKLARGKFVNKMSKPYAGDREQKYFTCAKDKGFVVPKDELVDHAVAIVKAWPAAMHSIIDGLPAAMNATTLELNKFDEKTSGAIDAWLKYHSDQVADAFSKGVAECKLRADMDALEDQSCARYLKEGVIKPGNCKPIFKSKCPKICNAAKKAASSI